MIHLLNGVNLLFRNYKNKTKIVPTIAITANSIFTDFKYLLVSGFNCSLENAPAPNDITIKKRNTKTSIVIKIPNLLSIFMLIILAYFKYFYDILS